MASKAPRFVIKRSLLAILLAFPAQQALAANCTWNPATGNWATAGNWNCGIVPGAADNATIALGKTVTVNTAQSILNLGNAGSVSLDAFLLTLAGGGGTTNTGTINVGAGAIPNNAALQVAGGHNINNTGGVINVSADSVINQFGSTITGGTINTTGSGKLVAFNSGSNVLSGVTLNGTLDLASGTGVESVVNGLTLNGTINIGNNSIFAPQGNQTIGGTGTINFLDASGNNRFNVEAGNLTLASGITVRGGNGSIGQQALVGGAATLTNQGTISADVNARTISMGVNGLVTNQGTLRAQNGGALQLNTGGGYDNSAGVILADTGSTVSMNGATITGGQLNSNGTGRIVANASGANFLQGVTLNGVLDMATAQGVARVSSGGMVLNGTINIGANSVLAPQGNQTISGNGTIVFADGNGSNRLNVEAGNLVIDGGVTVRGEKGIIGQQAFVGGAATLTNNGTIQADVLGGAITLAVNGSTTNNGTLAALNGGTLNLDSSVVGNTGSQILAGAGSVVNQNGVTISGIVNTTGSGSFRANASGLNFLDAVTFSGTLDLAAAQGVERLANGLTLNNGTINIGANSVLAPQGNQTISGSGTIVFTDGSGSNRLNVEAGNLTIGGGITVRGETGVIGQQAFVGGAATLTNNGTIQADVAGGTVSLAVNGLTTNNGTLAALNGGTLNLNSAVQGNSGSQILAGSGSVVNQNGVTISGDMNLTGAGSFRPNASSNNFLSGVTLSGTLDLASAQGVERIAGGLTLNGATIDIGSNSVLAPQGNQTIGGTGTINFVDASGSNRLNVEAGNLTLASGITVRGGNGIIGQQAFVGGAATLTNQGLISADVAGRSISMQVNGTVTNEGTMRSQNGGTLQLNTGGGYDNTAGIILADTGSTVSMNGATITGGQLNSNGTGKIVANTSTGNFLQGVTLNGVLDMATAQGVARISNGGMVLNGTINIGSNSVLAPQGNQTISGSGQIVFADASGSNRLNVEAGNLVIDSGVTVRGQTGIIGQQAFVGGAANLTNNGTINADAGGTITINVNGSLTNNGTLRAQNGTLLVQDNLAGTGTLQVDAAGVMNLANGGNTQGRLLMGASGSAINIGTGHLTINNDYTNAGAGSGNSFDRRAGVTGTGQVRAGGDVAQVISGSGVTDGNTPNATLTIGNVRVGTNTFNYQIGNSGTTGPTLRGAIQTAANGGNISDARLSGSGVTASNYNAGGPGANSGDLAVVFNAASAGALAPLAGQVLNLRSNFENIADQKLNIVLAGGAAAYNAATGSVASPVTIANQRVNGSNTAALSISNTAAPGAFSEDLNASVASVNGPVVASGSVSGRVAGTSNTGSGAISVGIATGSAGFKTGTANIAFQTAGAVNGVSNGLGTASAGSQAVTVQGNVYQAASGQLLSAPLDFGTVQVGQAVFRDIVVRNTASGPAGFVEDLNATFGAKSGSGSALFDGVGGLTGIVAGATSSAANGNMRVNVNTTAAGTINGSIAINYSSAGAVAGISNGLGTIGVGSEPFGVSGTIDAQASVINQASPLINNPNINLGAVRVGDAAPTALVSITNQATVAPQAALNASISSGGAPVTASGTVNLLDPGATSTTLQVGLNTSVAGNYTGANAGSATVTLISDASNVGNCAPNCQLNLAPQTVSVSGKVYTAAVGQSTTPVVDFGIVRVGDSVAGRNVNVQNTAVVSGLNDTLQASLNGASGPFSAGSAANGIVAQGNGQIAVGLATAAAGVFSQNASVAFLSQNPDMADISAGADAPVLLKAQVNNVANAALAKLSGLGTLSVIGDDYTLDLGNVVLGTLGISGSLQVANATSGPADVLSGAFDLSGTGDADGFSFTGWNPFTNLAAGQSIGGLDYVFDATTLGVLDDLIRLDALSQNGSGPDLGQQRTLRIVANVIDQQGGGGTVPEPATMMLLTIALATLLLQRRRGMVH
ncbi:choice-of-anchor D domain-containing protein [Accumulibacter sp.]|uniref:beta strand repeat-containing protein n=1 Tax=Accumulibacter sp. TaxID=2053492 RepID=UPI0025F57297|nr:choice-of-anchor D domain-containing protein [Accumulibacter sp.]MCM8613460.1 choice-of-anchor D domain-containing protein [Accumulibacter sp.]MCM8637107.1 choice-of-anchor D domain-containing protein [Accumulibacter sp.]MCM8640848.1 choice-of-anchor D domain-containing protein [Accumulibacter sp.]